MASETVVRGYLKTYRLNLFPSVWKYGGLSHCCETASLFGSTAFYSAHMVLYRLMLLKSLYRAYKRICQGLQSPYRLAMSGVVLSAERVYGFAISEKGEG